MTLLCPECKKQVRAIWRVCLKCGYKMNAGKDGKDVIVKDNPRIDRLNRMVEK